MKKIFEKHEVLFAIFWIMVYVVGTGAADSISRSIGLEKSITLAFTLGLSIFLLGWISRHGLCAYYGLRRTGIAAAQFLYYIPLVILVSCNFWCGVQPNGTAVEAIFYIGSMLCVGFLEEVIFRGLLFRAMAKSGITSAIVVSSVTFGIGHIVNLINGSGADLAENLCQVCYAIAFGFLFVTIFYRGGSLIPCILMHSAINAISFFGAPVDGGTQIIISLMLIVIALGYTLFLVQTLPKQSQLAEFPNLQQKESAQ